MIGIHKKPSPEEQQKTKVKDLISDFAKTEKGQLFFVLLHEMAIERMKYGDYANTIALGNMTPEEIQRRVIRRDFYREIFKLLDEGTQKAIAYRILK